MFFFNKLTFLEAKSLSINIHYAIIGNQLVDSYIGYAHQSIQSSADFDHV